MAWSMSTTHDTKVIMSCDHNEDGTPFNGGSMWQWHLTIDSDINHISWAAPLITCSSGGVAPKCPPFSKCVDSSCHQCIDAAKAVSVSLLEESKPATVTAL